jgi:predicted nucleic acid-binding protein
MSERGVPSDATTLIYLAKAGAFNVVAACGMTILAPPAVWREAVEAGEAAGYADAARIREAERRGLITRIGLTSEQEARASATASSQRLGEGEAEALAIPEPGEWVLVDDGRAARVATALGLVPISTLFLPVLAARRARFARDEAIAALRAIAVAANARAEAVIELEAWIRGER